jgi:hypothetical protein
MSNIETTLKVIFLEAAKVFGKEQSEKLLIEAFPIVKKPVKEEKKTEDKTEKRIGRMTATIANKLKAELVKVGVKFTDNEKKELDMGVLYVTNQRLIFDGLVKNNTWTYKSILAIEPYEDGIRVEKEKGKSPVFQMLVPEEKLTIILGRIFSEMKD